MRDVILLCPQPRGPRRRRGRRPRIGVPRPRRRARPGRCRADRPGGDPRRGRRCAGGRRRRDQGPLGSARLDPRRTARAPQALPAGPVRLPAQADVAADPRARRARGDAALGRPRRRAAAVRAPWFVKPVVGRLSQDARRIDDAARLDGASGWDDYRAGYARSATGRARRGRGARLSRGGGRSGQEVTLEGFSHRGRVTTIGVTDSVKYPGTNSFERFEYPSRLPSERLAELAAAARRVVPALGFDDGFFNVEFFVPDEGRGRSSRGERAARVPVRAARPGCARPLDLRRPAPARVRRGSGVGAPPARVPRRELCRPAVRGRVRGGGAAARARPRGAGRAGLRLQQGTNDARATGSRSCTRGARAASTRSPARRSARTRSASGCRCRRGLADHLAAGLAVRDPRHGNDRARERQACRDEHAARNASTFAADSVPSSSGVPVPPCDS